MSRVERAKEAGWRIECLGNQQDGLWNWLLWSPEDAGCIQTQEPLASEIEAWEYYFGFVKGLQYDVGIWQPAPTETGARGDSAFAQAAQGDDALAVALYEAATLRTELDTLRQQLAAAEAANERLSSALEPFAEAWLQVPLGVESRLWIDRYVEGAKIGTESLGISTDTLQDAHTAWAGLPEASGGEGEGVGE